MIEINQKVAHTAAALCLAFVASFPSAHAAIADPLPRPTPEGPRSAGTPIYNEDVEAHLPLDLTGAHRATVRWVMLELPPATRPQIRWVLVHGRLVVYVSSSDPNAWQPVIAWDTVITPPSLDTNTYFDAETGETRPGAPSGEPPLPGPVKLKKTPVGWKLHAYVPAPADPDPVADADIDAYLPNGLAPLERAEVVAIMTSGQNAVPPASRRLIRWDYPAAPPPHSPHPAFGFVVFQDDPNVQDAPNVCFPNLVLGVRTTQYWCPYYREALVDPGPDTIAVAPKPSYSIVQLDPKKLAQQQPPWVQYSYVHPPAHPKPLPNVELAGYIPRDLSAKESGELRHLLLDQPPSTRRLFLWTRADDEFVVFYDNAQALLHEIQAGEETAGQPLTTTIGPAFCMENLVGPPDRYYCPFYHELRGNDLNNYLWSGGEYGLSGVYRWQ
jgi:hypothetical protein